MRALLGRLLARRSSLFPDRSSAVADFQRGLRDSLAVVRFTSLLLAAGLAGLLVLQIVQ